MRQLLYFSFLLLLAYSCSEKENKMIDIQGHRGCRGHLPENSIPAFIEAIKMGVTTLEMDVVVTSDHRVVVSHEPFLSSEICLDTTGIEISENEQMNFNIYEMSYSTLSKFECGLKHHPRFPEQQKISVFKPLLSEVIDSVESYIEINKLSQIKYNIEIKSTEEGDKVYHPTPSEFTELVLRDLKEKSVLKRATLQSFDIRTLQYLHQYHPDVQMAFLVENKDGVIENLNKLGFIPPIYSCEHVLLNEEEVKVCRENNMQVIPWTVNEINDIERMLNLDVDGIISDYPDRVMKLIGAKEIS